MSIVVCERLESHYGILDLAANVKILLYGQCKNDINSISRVKEAIVA